MTYPFTDNYAEAASLDAQICPLCGEICDGSCQQTSPQIETTDSI